MPFGVDDALLLGSLGLEAAGLFSDFFGGKDKPEVPSISPSFRSPFVRSSYDPTTGATNVSLDPSEQRLLDEARARLSAILPDLRTTTPERESRAGLLGSKYLDIAKRNIFETDEDLREAALERLGARNLLGSSIEARRSSDIDEVTSKALQEASDKSYLYGQDFLERELGQIMNIAQVLEGVRSRIAALTSGATAPLSFGAEIPLKRYALRYGSEEDSDLFGGLSQLGTTALLLRILGGGGGSPTPTGFDVGSEFDRIGSTFTPGEFSLAD